MEKKTKRLSMRWHPSVYTLAKKNKGKFEKIPDYLERLVLKDHERLHGSYPFQLRRV